MDDIELELDAMDLDLEEDPGVLQVRHCGRLRAPEWRLRRDGVVVASGRVPNDYRRQPVVADAVAQSRVVHGFWVDVASTP